jgi:phage terminase large subunit-like protein
MNERLVIRPQDGPQFNFINSRADITIYGGGAGGGKSYALLLEPLKHKDNPRFDGCIFRRTTVDIKKQGSLWPTSSDLYPMFGARGSSQSLLWRFPSNATIAMGGIEHDKDRFDYQSAQFAYLGFDEVTHFSEQTFWYMMSRNRSMSGIRPYIRAACNPDPDSWVKTFIQWWIDSRPVLRDGKPNPRFGFPFPGRDGVIRWFVRRADRIEWAFTREELEAKYGKWDPIKFTGVIPKSVTFIKATVFDNPALLGKNPDYLANLQNLPAYERAQLLDGNWEVRAQAGDLFPRSKIQVVDEPPRPFSKRARGWDRAASVKKPGTDPDATANVLISQGPDGLWYVEWAEEMWEAPYEVNGAMKACATQDGYDTIITFNQDPGSAGVYEAQDTAKELAGYMVQYEVVRGDKVTQAKPFSNQWRAGNVRLVRGAWNEQYLRVMGNFYPGSPSHDDLVDASSRAFKTLTEGIDVYVA